MPVFPLALTAFWSSSDYTSVRQPQSNVVLDSNKYATDFSYWITHLSNSDILSLIGLLLGLVGFYFTIKGILDTKSQVELTKREIDSLKSQVNFSESIRSLSQIVSQVEELVHIFSEDNWDRYVNNSSSICSKLSTLREHPNIGDNVTKVNDILTGLRAIENKVISIRYKKVKFTGKTDAQASLLSYRDELNSLLASFSYEVTRP